MEFEKVSGGLVFKLGVGVGVEGSGGSYTEPWTTNKNLQSEFTS